MAEDTSERAAAAGAQDEEVTTDTSAAATLFDLRTVIAALFGLFGVILVLVAVLDTTQAELDKAGGLPINLWTGVSMLVVSVVFFVWVRTRPPLAAASEAEDPAAPDG